jgi:DNA-binding MarR family transcriptional regulator
VDGPAVPARLAELPTWLLGQLAARSHQLVLDATGGAAPRTFYAVLACIDDGGPTSQADISRRTGIDPADLVATLRAMEGEGLVEREADAGDARRNVVSLTRRGRSELRRLAGALAAAQDQLLSPLRPEDRTVFVRFLKVLVDHHTNLHVPPS